MIVFRMAFILTALILGIYFYCYIRRVIRFYGADADKTQLRILAAALAALLALGCTSIWSLRTVVILHLAAFAVLLDIIAVFVKRIFRKRKTDRAYKVCKRIYGCGLLPVVITGILLIYGYMNMQNVVQTEYRLETKKKTGNYKLLLLSDTHYGTVQETGILKDKVKEMNEQSPDIVVLCGDIVEEGTSKEKMEEVFQILGGIEARYGIYYVYGNHDRQPYTKDRSYTDAELEDAITENQINILEDTYVEINQALILAGRGDAAWGNMSGRDAVKELLKDADKEKYIIVADHQPIEAEENSAEGADLLVSGHTHAGQIWPVGVLSELIGILNYGEYESDGCKVIVSSGFTGWGYPIRTEKHCEYVVIHIGGSMPRG